MTEIPDALRPPRYPPAPSASDPNFLRAAQWLSQPAPADPSAYVLGVPFSVLSLSGARCDLTSAAVRSALWSLSTWLASREVDLGSVAVHDVGDIDLGDLGTLGALDRIRDVCAAFRDGPPVAIVGGDNSVMAPAFQGLGCDALLTLDAHHDVREGLSNGSPVRQLIDAGLPGGRVWQVGIADMANSRPYADYAGRAGITVVGVREVRSRGTGAVVDAALEQLRGHGRVYVDVDVDVVERALAPGCPAALPGGLAPSDLIDAAFACGAHPSVVALDIVEVDPERDVAQATVRLAAQILLSFLAGVSTR